MQIDFHHAVTYVAARLAGLADPEAQVVAWSAQYVDDATDEGYLAFSNGAMYCHIASAHKMLDYRDLDALSNHRAWIPFHFLPGNDGLPAGEGNQLDFARRIICRADSPLARDMVDQCIRDAPTRPWALHHLGITMHVYADTWAHQGFSGIADNRNQVHDLRDHENRPYQQWIRHINEYYSRSARIRNRIADYAAGWPRLKQFLKRWLHFDLDASAMELLNNLLPLGHGAALSVPDKPYLIWRYRDGEGREITRDNAREFVVAADAMCRAMQRFNGMPAHGLPDTDKAQMEKLFRDITDPDPTVRHAIWLDEIRRGAFSFGKVEHLGYVETGAGSWKEAALVMGKDDWDDALFPWLPSFLSSHWKLFHDALQAHRLFVLNDLLPRYGICAA